MTKSEFEIPCSAQLNLFLNEFEKKILISLTSFGDFRCGVLLFMVILVIYKYKNK